MTTTKLFFLAQTVLIPIVFYLFRFKDIKQLYFPLFIYLLVKEATEIVSYILIHFYHTSNAVPYNLMFLLDAVLLTWQYYNLGAFKTRRQLYNMLQVFWVILWASDMFLIGSILEFNIVYRVSSCFILVFIAASLISTIAVKARYNLYRNTAFIICVLFACWFTYNILFEFSDRISHINEAYKNIGARITSMIGFVEAFMFLICAWAVYCIPAKRKFITT